MACRYGSCLEATQTHSPEVYARRNVLRCRLSELNVYSYDHELSVHWFVKPWFVIAAWVRAFDDTLRSVLRTNGGFCVCNIPVCITVLGLVLLIIRADYASLGHGSWTWPLAMICSFPLVLTLVCKMIFEPIIYLHWNLRVQDNPIMTLTVLPVILTLLATRI